MNILLAGDDEDFLAVLGYGLRRYGYDVVAIRLGEMAAQPWRVECPSLIIIDDWRWRPAAPSLPWPEDTPVPGILLTPWPGAPAAANRLGWEAVLSKPFLLADLIRVIEAIGRHGAEEPAHGPQLAGQRDLD